MNDKYNKLTRESLEKAVNKVFSQNNLGKGLYEQLTQQNIYVYDSSRLGNIVFEEFGYTIKLPYKFKTESGKIIELENKKYHNLKQETKDKLEPYRIIENYNINGNI